MIHPEFVAEILDGIKDIEYRTWSTKHRGDFLIGCTQSKSYRSCVCAVACLDDVAYFEDEDVYEWYLSNIREIIPLPIRGQQRLFESGIELEEVEFLADLTPEEIEARMKDVDTWLVKDNAKQKANAKL